MTDTRRRGWITDGSGTALETEYRDIVSAMQRCAPASVTFDRAKYDPKAIEWARTLWQSRMLAEHRSTAVFAALATQLIEAGATVDLVAVVLRMAQDELRHAEVCGHVVIALGGDPVCTPPAAIAPLATHKGRSLEERALRNVIYGCCLTEMVNAARLVDEHDRATDPFIREATRQLLADEASHAQFGFVYLDAWADWLQSNPAVRQSIGDYLQTAFGYLEQTLSGAGHPPRELTADENALGLPDPVRLPLVFYETVTGAVVPGLERHGIEAAKAWGARRGG